VLTVNHVVDILAHFANSNDWKEAFEAVIPQRKQIKETTEIKEDKETEREKEGTEVKEETKDSNSNEDKSQDV